MPLPTPILPSQDHGRFSSSSLEEKELAIHFRQGSLSSLPSNLNNNNHISKSSAQGLGAGSPSSSTPSIPPPPHSPSLTAIPAGNNPDYVNTRMEDHTWYVGEMDRDGAVQLLSRYPSCTFLVRRRFGDVKNGGYALSLQVENEVKHMRICTSVETPKSLTPPPSDLNESNNSWKDSRQSSSCSTASGHTDWYYLSDSRKFKSIVELVHWYSRNSLRESFNCLDTTLRFPVKELCMVEARYDFSPGPEDKNMIHLKVGDQVAIIDRTGDARGWWKACRGNRIGYIPKNFVVVID